ncbi:ATP-dependent RNA helicase [Allostreptomyces psammosilenae]|uniref:ATP-dependent helicase HrpB n=1 Tax=Allostreptomyces psammosilenae TaxID=1892865 RepID=A0A852ZZB9_9ACTN|nr:ATP-dependent helicase C-terminal domain-containing protein [Allostreptomyces psammosilenae]NYI07177.1 ATP-dependent helicase HrpB [Allostreptomyces psammosilenae]
MALPDAPASPDRATRAPHGAGDPFAPFDLPIRERLPALLRALETTGSAVLAAPPGTGKTTLAPLALAGLVPGLAPSGGGRQLGGQHRAAAPGPVLVAEPRRMAARAAARRMAWMLGEPVGRRVGFAVRGERRAGPETVVEVVTTGVLLQRLQHDPELGGGGGGPVATVLLDECHERHLDADTTLAFLLDVRAALRPDLRLVAASATADTDVWARLLTPEGEEGPAPVVRAESILHPVEAVWAPPERPLPPPRGTRVDPAFLDHVAATVRRALAERDGDVLCFLPGVGELARVRAALEGGTPGVRVLTVHGGAAPEVQDEVLRPGDGRRVVLATAVAESSLTVPGVRVVVDSGLAREPRTDHARGLGSLTTRRASLASVDQRAGRAGREGPGTVYRCWSPADHDRLPARPTPEIATADLTGFALQVACWGDPDATGLTLPDPPPAMAMAVAREVLASIAAVDREGRVTPRGRRLARLGVHPRLARALLDGADRVGARRAAEVVALLSEPLPRDAGEDLAEVWRRLRAGRGGRSGDGGAAARWREEAERLRRALRTVQADPAGGGDADDAGGVGGEPGRRTTPAAAPADALPADTLPDDAAAGLVAALAFPERLARRREGRGGHLMVSGTAAEVAAGSRAAQAPWLAIAVADRPQHAAAARVRLAVEIDAATAREAAGHLLRTDDEVAWVVPDGQRRGDVVARRVERLGAVELSSRPLRAPDPALLRAAVLDGLRREGPALLPWPAAAVALRQRLAFLHRELGAPWPDVSDDALVADAELWLGPELAGARRRADLERVDTVEALRRLLPWADGSATRLDELAPERVAVPSGSRVRVDYTDERPVLAVKLQELFGWRRAPALAGGRVPLVVHLLSPAGRPVAVTGDLESFWADGYRQVRAELRGRYPRHPWPEDPTTAEPTRRTNPRRA